MSHGLYDLCACGHVHPEHSLFGTCRGCLDCEARIGPIAPEADGAGANAGPDEADDHEYRQCTCLAFSRAEEIA